MTKKKEPIHPIDCFAGQKLREARLLRGLNQKQLGEQLSQPITFQQIQKYEKGANRIAVSRLYEFAEALHVPITYFLPDLTTEPLPALNLQESRLLDNYRSLTLKQQAALVNLLNIVRQE